MFRSWTCLYVLPLLAPSCIIFPKLYLSSGDAPSFEQQFINSISTLFPKNLFSLYRQNIVSFCCCLFSPRDIYFKGETFSKVSPKVRVLLDFLSGYNLSQLKHLIQWNNLLQNCTAAPEQIPITGYSNQLVPAMQKPQGLLFEKRHSFKLFMWQSLPACNYSTALRPTLNQTQSFSHRADFSIGVWHEVSSSLLIA